MNKQRRKELAEIFENVQALKERLETLIEEEQEAYDNLPESLQNSERGENMDSALCDLNDAAEYLGDVCDNLENVLNI